MSGIPAMRSLLAAALVAALVMLAGTAKTETFRKIAAGGVSATAAEWPNYVALDKGFFRAEGLDVEVTHVGNVANTVRQLVGGSFEVAISTFDTAVRAIVNGGNIVIIGSTTLKYPYSVMTAPDVARAGDLKGKSISLPFAKDFLAILWNRWLTEQGMAPAEVDQVYDGATFNRFAALASGTVQAAALGQPFDFRAADQGYRKLLDLGAYGKDYGFLAVVARTDWLGKDPAAARAYLRALAHAVDWLYDPANRAEAIEVLSNATGAETSLAARTYDYYVGELKPYSRHLVVPERVVKTTLDTLVEIGDVERSDKRLLDTSYLPP